MTAARNLYERRGLKGPSANASKMLEAAAALRPMHCGCFGYIRIQYPRKSEEYAMTPPVAHALKPPPPPTRPPERIPRLLPQDRCYIDGAGSVRPRPRDQHRSTV